MDLIIFKAINGLAGNFYILDLLAVFLAKYFPYVLLLVFLIILWRKKGKILWIGLVSAFASRYILTEVIRYFYSRPRPFEVLSITQLVEHSPGGSFPSGHMAFFFALSAGVYFWNKKAGVWFFIASSLIGLARIFAGLHWPSDILGGAALGFLIFRIAKIVYEFSE